MSGNEEAAGAGIARARRRRGLSQSVLAGLVGRSESWLSQVERGKRGVDSYVVLTRMAEVLRVEVTGQPTAPTPRTVEILDAPCLAVGAREEIAAHLTGAKVLAGRLDLRR